MFTKKAFFVFLALIALFLSASLLSASDVKTEDLSKAATEVKADTDPSNKSDTLKVNTININKATEVELSAGLKKVGPKYAAAIVKYREENGDFKSPEDIKKVKGIGDKIFEMNKDVIVVAD
ncbi:MAG: helix-hairpin-helix domain-containing protein [Desulfamplus sp.]|nr:helix-hairpin-helix domain-containing protein [Desulfamplus sp.]